MIHMNNRIAIFISSMEGGGAQRSILNLARGIASRGIPVDLLLARAVGPYMDEIPESVRLVDLRSRRVLRSIPRVVRYLRSEQPAAMLSSLTYVNIVALWAKRLSRVPVPLFVNEQNTLSCSASNSKCWRNRVTPHLAKRFYHWADGIVTVSDGVRQDLAQTTNIDSDRIKVIFNPSIVRSHVQQKARQRVDHPWLQGDGPPVLLAVGRLHQQKDFPTLLHAFAKVRKNGPVKLLILGEGDDRAELEALIRRLGLDDDVNLPGFVDNPFAYMARASLFVLSSRWEGLPTVLVEALCCGAPVVSTDCPSGPREILRGSKYGRLVPVGDVACMASAIEEALKGGLVRPPHESWAPFELDAVVDRYLSLLLAPEHEFHPGQGRSEHQS